jgi:hypothetical protein
MKNGHLRFLPVTFYQKRRDSSTRITAFCDRFAGDENKTHLLSLTASDSVMAAFTAALSEDLSFNICLPGMDEQSISLGTNAFTWKASIPMPGRKQPLRHVIALSEELHSNNTETGVFILDSQNDIAWAVIVREEKRIEDLTGYNCNPVRICASRDELLTWIGDGVRLGFLGLPTENGPIQWPNYSLRDVLLPSAQNTSDLETAE